jgi:CHASE3 domain sensor protein
VDARGRDGSTSVVGWYSSLAIDGSNVPHISYYNVTTGRLWYAKKPGVLWTKEQVDGLDSDVGTDCNIRLDGSGLPGISYYDFTNQNLKYAHRSAGGVWTAENADESEDDSGRFSSLAFDGSGNPCISYYNSSTGQLMYARKSGGVWSHEVVDPSTDNRGQFSSLRIDGAGRPCISYYDANNQDLMYAWKNGASWVIETANGAEDLDVGRESALALDIANSPHITFYDNTNQHWLYAHKVGGAWQTMTVDGSFNVRGQFGSIQMTAGGIPRMSCFDATSATLLYAYGPSENVSVGDRPRTAIASLSVFPNPSPAGVTRIHWVGEGLAPDAAVDILDAGGRRIRRLSLDATGEARWDGTDDRGRAVRAGINFVKPVGGRRRERVRRATGRRPLSAVPGTVTDVAAAPRVGDARTGVAAREGSSPAWASPALVATVMLVTIASGIWAWLTAREMERRMTTMVGENVPSVVAAAELQAALLQQRGLVAAYMLDGGRLAWVNDLDKLKPELLRRLDAAQRSARTDEERTLLTQLTNVYAQYDAERERAIALYHDGHREAARDLLLGDVSRLSDQAQRLCRDLVSANRRFMSASLERGRQQLTWLAFLLPALIGVTTLLCLGVLVIVSRRLLRPVRQLARDARTFSTEDSARAGTPFNDDVHELEYYSRAIMSDATRVRADLEHQQRRLVNAEKLAAVGKFAACAAHELRNPLGAMKLWLHELKHTGAASAAVTQTCTVLEEEVLRLEELATSFLQHSKPPQLKLCAHGPALDRRRHAGGRTAPAGGEAHPARARERRAAAHGDGGREPDPAGAVEPDRERRRRHARGRRGADQRDVRARARWRRRSGAARERHRTRRARSDPGAPVRAVRDHEAPRHRPRPVRSRRASCRGTAVASSWRQRRRRGRCSPSASPPV